MDVAHISALQETPELIKGVRKGALKIMRFLQRNGKNVALSM